MILTNAILTDATLPGAIMGGAIGYYQEGDSSAFTVNSGG